MPLCLKAAPHIAAAVQKRLMEIDLLFLAPTAIP
jgi:hypothetical protein